METLPIPSPPLSGRYLGETSEWMGSVTTAIEAARSGGQGLEFDLSGIRFMSPFSALPLAALCSETRKGQPVTILPPEDNDCRAYFRDIHFPEGGPLKAGRSYSPVLRWSPEDDTSVSGALYAFFSSQMGGSSFSIDSVIYPFSELWDNIANHAESEFGWCQWQYYPSEDRLDVCILDRGITIAGAYRKTGQSITDRHALMKALDGVSTKGGKERGFGLRTSVRLISASAFKGEFWCVSGAAGFRSGPGEDKPQVFDIAGWSWKGTLIMFRFFKAEVDLYSFVED